jgi:hypothetical protein
MQLPDDRNGRIQETKFIAAPAKSWLPFLLIVFVAALVAGVTAQPLPCREMMHGEPQKPIGFGLITAFLDFVPAKCAIAKRIGRGSPEAAMYTRGERSGLRPGNANLPIGGFSDANR